MMGYDLYNEQGDYFRWNVMSFPRVLQLAKDYGWEPAGTTMSYQYLVDEDEDGFGVVVSTDEPQEGYELHYDPADWGGGYMSNDGQRVTAEDAAALADALELAVRTGLPAAVNLEDFEDISAAIREAIAANSDPDAEIIAPDSSLDYEQLGAFIDFCRKGAFRIT